MRVLWVCGALIAVAGCVAEPETPPNPPSLEPSCSADQLSDLVGKDAKILATMRFASDVRILPPGSVVTMEYNPARTNIIIDDKNIISSITCG